MRKLFAKAALVVALASLLAIESSLAQVKVISDKGQNVAAVPAPTLSVDQLMADCRKYFGNRKYKVSLAPNLAYNASQERFYNFGTQPDTAPKLVDGICVLGYNWTNNDKGWYKWNEGKFDGVNLLVGDKRWEWGEITPQADGTLIHNGTYTHREGNRTVYPRHEPRIFIPIN